MTCSHSSLKAGPMNEDDRAIVAELLTAGLLEEFAYLLNHETAQLIARQVIDRLGTMQEYSGKVAWGKL